MRKAVLFNEFSYQCQFFDSDIENNNGYGCCHPEQEEEGCYCFSCPLGIEAEQQDLTGGPDAVLDEIDWDGFDEDGEIDEGEILLVNVDDDATEEEKKALARYDSYMHRYDKYYE